VSVTGSGAGGGKGGGGAGQVSTVAVEEDYELVGIQAYLGLGESLGVSLGYYDALDGRNTGLGHGFTLGLVWGLEGPRPATFIAR